MLSTMLRHVTDVLIPPRCASCDVELATSQPPLVCERCRHELASMPIARCLRCGAAGAPLHARECALCRGVTLHFDTATALGNYEGLVRAAVLRIKRWREQSLAQALAELAVAELSTELRAWRPDVVVPVPMHWRRRLLRGCNSPDTTAIALAHALRIPAALESLVRSRATQAMGELRPTERPENVRGAFRLRRAEDFGAARVLLVDDILTTGATASESARVLKQAGATNVGVAVLARAQGQHRT